MDLTRKNDKALFGAPPQDLLPGSYHGKMPWVYASKRRSTHRSPPMASSPSSLASVGSGNDISFSLIRNTGMFITLS